MRHVSPDTCYVSHVTCHVSHLACHVSPVTCFNSQTVRASQNRICYQQGLPRLVSSLKHTLKPKLNYLFSRSEPFTFQVLSLKYNWLSFTFHVANLTSDVCDSLPLSWTYNLSVL